MKKKFSLFLVIAILSVYILQPITVNAASETLGDLLDNLNALKQKKIDNENNKNQSEAEIKQKEKAIKNAETQIQKAQIEAREAQEKIEESNIKIEELKKESEKLFQFLQQMKSSNAYLEYVSGASSTTDLIMRIAAINQITEYNQSSLDALEALIIENQKLKDELIAKEASLETEIKSYEKTIQTLYGKIETYDKFETDIDTQISQAQSTYNVYKTMCSTNPNTKDQGNKAKLTDCEVFPDASGGVATNYGWKKPLVYGVITSTIGIRWGSYHNALDIGGNSEGTNVYAAAHGTVSGIIERYWCGGNMLYLNVLVNGQKYTLYYYHLLEIKVKIGQIVTPTTIVGTVGGGKSTSASYGGYDSCTTGAHLHYGVATGYYTGTIKQANVITPPGFPNTIGYTFTNRDAYYG